VTLFLRHEDVLASITMAEAIDAVELGFMEEGNGDVQQPPRLNIPIGDPKGFLRVGPCVMKSSRWMGFKAMNLAEGQGCRYQVHLYSMDDGALKAIMDAQLLTTLRTGATSGLATRYLGRAGSSHVGVIGSGREAFMQLEAMRAIGRADSAKVYSPSPDNRRRFAAHFRENIGLDITECESAEEAVEGADVVVAAVASPRPALFGRWLKPGMHVNSVGTARPTLREIDEDVLRRSDRIVVDTREGVFNEAGDCVVARSWLDPRVADELADLACGRSPGRTSRDQITLFKSVGTAVQDIALAVRIFHNASDMELGQKLDDFPALIDKTPPKLKDWSKPAVLITD
jgi:ornithine cyclodeaminase/alanine dehydrogenase-like protein (mu-crystallin family)